MSDKQSVDNCMGVKTTDCPPQGWRLDAPRCQCAGAGAGATAALQLAAAAATSCRDPQVLRRSWPPRRQPPLRWRRCRCRAVVNPKPSCDRGK